MRLLRRSALILMCCAVPFLGAASAHADIVVPTIGMDYAIDGNDLYTLDSKYGRRHITITIMRQPLTGGKRVKVGSVKDGFNDEETQLFAGGGRVAILSSYDGTKAYVTKVISFDRKGKDRRVLATGSIPMSKPRCGTRVELFGASNTGSFAIGRGKLELKTKACGAKRDASSWRYEEVRPGVKMRREIYAADAATKGRYKLAAPVARIDLNGDYAAVVSAFTLRVRIRNLATGVLYGPFVDGPRAAGLTSPVSNRISLSSSGALLIDSDWRKKNGIDGKSFLDLFLDPNAPAQAVRPEHDENAVFCGDRLVTIARVDVPGGAHRVVELDPRTFSEVRTLAAAPYLESIATCDATRMVLVTYKNDGAHLTPVKFPD